MNDSPSIHRVRPVEIHEIDECMKMGMPLFAKKYPHMAWDDVHKWCEVAASNANVLFCRTDNSVGVCWLRAPSPFEPFIVCNEEFVFSTAQASAFEALAIYRTMASWAKSRNAVALDFGSGTGIDISAIAKRLHAEPRQTIYRLNLG